MMDRYILNGHEVVPCPDLAQWAKFIEGDFETTRKVARTKLNGCEVSTVFLGIDHAFGGGPPVLFETLIFGGVYDQEQERYHTWDEAAAGHARWVAKCEAAIAGAFA